MVNAYAVVRMRRTAFFSALSIAALMFTMGCVRMDVLPKPDSEINRPVSEPMRQDAMDVPLDEDPTQIYRVGPRDVVRVDVRKDPSLSQEYAITEEGYILLPHIGPVAVADLTTEQIEEKLNRVLADFIREPEAKVGVKEYLSKQVYVIGQVNQPGPKIMRADQLTLLEAISAAGLPNANGALQRVRVISPDRENPLVYQVNLTDVLYRGEMAQNMLLKPNDIVYVPARHSFSLTAALREVLTPVEQITSLRYRATFGDLMGGNDSSYLDR